MMVKYKKNKTDNYYYSKLIDLISNKVNIVVFYTL